jgi:hypothetical protein
MPCLIALALLFGIVLSTVPAGAYDICKVRGLSGLFELVGASSCLPLC